MAELQAAGVSRIIRKAGAERVSAEATEQFREYLEMYGKELAEEAIEMAKHAGRKTVKSEDIKLAYTKPNRESRDFIFNSISFEKRCYCLFFLDSFICSS